MDKISRILKREIKLPKFATSLMLVLIGILALSTIAYAGKYIAFTDGRFEITGTDNLTVADGKVGIGTSTPAYKLDVNGVINATDIYKNGVAFTGGGAGSGSNVPANTIAAFNQASCPAGWIPADGTSGTPDLRGIFIRGAGVSGTRTMANGSHYSAAFGTYQNDKFQGHNRDIISTLGSVNDVGGLPPSVSGNGLNGGGISTNPVYLTGNYYNDGTNGTPRTGAETAPASYALVYCMKTSEDSETSNTIWGTSGSNVFVQDTSKNVGIGTTSPNANLQVNGTVSMMRRVTEQTYSTDTQYTAPTDILVIVTVSGGNVSATPAIVDVTDGITYSFDYYGQSQANTSIIPIPKGHIWRVYGDSRIPTYQIYVFRLGI